MTWLGSISVVVTSSKHILYCEH